MHLQIALHNKSHLSFLPLDEVVHETDKTITIFKTARTKPLQAKI